MLVRLGSRWWDGWWTLCLSFSMHTSRCWMPVLITYQLDKHVYICLSIFDLLDVRSTFRFFKMRFLRWRKYTRIRSWVWSPTFQKQKKLFRKIVFLKDMADLASRRKADSWTALPECILVLAFSAHTMRFLETYYKDVTLFWAVQPHSSFAKTRQFVWARLQNQFGSGSCPWHVSSWVPMRRSTFSHPDVGAGFFYLSAYY